jgi:hypothetical protein
MPSGLEGTTRMKYLRATPFSAYESGIEMEFERSQPRMLPILAKGKDDAATPHLPRPGLQLDPGRMLFDKPHACLATEFGSMVLAAAIKCLPPVQPGGLIRDRKLSPHPS